MARSLLLLFCFTATVSQCCGQISFTRTVNSLAAGTSGSANWANGCIRYDVNGCSAGTEQWGNTVTLSLKATLGKPIESGSTFSVDSKIDSFIPFKFSCPLCGANCSITIPVVGKSVSFAMPPCPIAAGSIAKTLTVRIPLKDPIPANIKATGTATATDASGASLASISFSAYLKKPSSFAVREGNVFQHIRGREPVDVRLA